MASVRFNLDQPRSTTPTKIFLIYWINKTNRLKWYFGEKVLPKSWNFEKQRALRSHQGFDTLNMLLTSMESFILDEIRLGQINGELPSATILKRKLNNRYLEVNEGPMAFYEFVDAFIQKRKDSPKFKKDSVKVYSTAKTRLEEYDKHLTFDKIDLDWFYSFTGYLFKKKYSTNYVGRLIISLKAILNEATDLGINKNLAFKSRRFNISEKEVDNIYLNEDELEKIYKKVFKLESTQNAANLFLIGAYTGLRYSDFSNIDIHRDQIEHNGVAMLKIRTQKTGEQVAIPIHPVLKDVLENRSWTSISNQKLNLYLKDMGEEVELNEFVHKVTYPGSKEVSTRYRKYQLITTHTARRSFATNAFLAGVPVPNIMKITGHRTEKAFHKYIKISKEQNAVLMSKSNFFRGKLKISG